MCGKFDGITDEQWGKLSLVVPELPYVFGRPHPDRRKLLNTMLYVLITGCRWCDVPTGEIWAKRSTAHKYLGLWSKEGVLTKIKDSLLEDAELRGLISWGRGSIDGSFSPWEGRR